jgi:RNA 2',3'-cyclic 3'-phosphodiesterase
VALELPAAVRTALESWGREVTGDDRALRAVGRDDLHVTLCFLGWQSADEVPRIADVLQSARDLAARSASEVAGSEVAGSEVAGPQLRVRDAIWLPPRRPGVLAVRLHDRTGEAARLQVSLAGVLQQGGWYEPEARPFLAHVTVARVRRRARPRTREPLPALAPLSFRAPSVTLYRSRLGPSGARYERLSRVSLPAG